MDLSLQSLSRLFCAVCLLAASAVAAAADVRVSIEGLRGEPQEAARASLSLSHAKRDATPAQIRRLLSDGKAEIAKALEPFGYYNARVTGELRQREGRIEATFRVLLGDPVIVRQSQVLVLGAGAEMPRVKRAVQRFHPTLGEVLDHAIYEQSKGNVENALLNEGFIRNKATQHRVEVVRKANTANIDLAWQSGPRMRFGAVHFSEAQFPPQFLERFIPWEAGDYYSPDELLMFQQKLIDGDYFSTVTVLPDLSNEKSIDVPIDVTLAPAKRSVYTATAYISTDTGPGLRLAATRRWINRRGHKADVSLDNAQRLQAITTSYRIPLPGRDNRSYNFGATYRDENTATSTSRNTRATANETRQWHGFTRTLGVQYLSGNFEIADEQTYSTLVYGEATLSKKQANDLFFPRRGYSVAFGTRLAPGAGLGDARFSQFTADAKWIRAFGARQRVLLRGSVGVMAVDDFDQLPPELRFFAGGDRSVRGFDYQEIGSINAAGKVVGGQYLTVASAEYERYFLRNWGAAVFVDAGDAFRSAEFNLNIGAGVGVRWRSPVGIVRVDFAKPVSSTLSDNIRFHITIGPDL